MTTKLEEPEGDFMHSGHEGCPGCGAAIAMRFVLKGSRFIHIFASCPTGWRLPSEMAVKIARMAVQTNIFPLYEVEDGTRYTLNFAPKGYLVREYFRLQGRFKHLTDADLEAIQQMVDEDWQLLQRKAGLSAL